VLSVWVLSVWVLSVWVLSINRPWVLSMWVLSTHTVSLVYWLSPQRMSYIYTWNVCSKCVRKLQQRPHTTQRHTPHDIPHTTYDIHHMTYHIPHTTYGIRLNDIHHMTYHTPHTTYHIRHTTQEPAVPSVSFAEYCLFHRALLQKRPIIWRSLLIVATPYTYMYICECCIFIYQSVNVIYLQMKCV